jgi:hypothetical protein
VRVGEWQEVDQVTAEAAAADLARQLGARVDEVTVLHNGSNVSVLLAPEMVVAKVGRRRRHIRQTADWFEREVAVTRYLRPWPVRTAVPASVIAPGPHWHQGHLISFWERIAVSDQVVPPETAGAALRQCHRALTGYVPAGEPFDPAAECDRVLAGTPPWQFLAGEYELLESLADQLFDVVRSWDGPTQALHGDPTPENILASYDGQVWCDFEDTYVGSTWWDVACLLAPAEVAGDVDFRDRAAAGYGICLAEPAAAAFLAARVMHSAIWSAYVNSPGPSPRRLRRLAWLERAGRR